MPDSGFLVNHFENHSVYNMQLPHTHSGYELFYQLLGSRVYVIGGESFTLTKGEALIIAPGVAHRTLSSDGVFYERILINFDRSALPEGESFDLLYSSLSSGKEYCRFSFSGSQKKKLTNMMFSIAEEYAKDDIYAHAAAQSLLAGIIILLQRNREPESARNSDSVRIVSQVCEYIQKHYSEPITLEGLAKQFFVNEYTLSRYFNEITSISVPQYINTVRIENIKEYLATHPSASLTQAAIENGFNSSSYFNKVFKSFEGVSPSEYKNKFK